MIDRRRRPLHPAGGRRLRRDERLQRLRAAPVSRASSPALLNVDEATADRPETLAEVDRAVDVLGLQGPLLRAGLLAARLRAQRRPRRFRAVLGQDRRRASCRCSIELSSTPTYDRAGYLAQPRRPRSRCCARYPAHPFLLVMGPPVGHFGTSGAWEFPPEVLATYRRDNLLIEVMFPITWGGVWDYPYPEAQALIREHARPVRRGQARVGLRHAQRRALLHLPAVPRLRAQALQLPDAPPRRTPSSAATSPALLGLAQTERGHA